jgi:hypothetical protein
MRNFMCLVAGVSVICLGLVSPAAGRGPGGAAGGAGHPGNGGTAGQSSNAGGAVRGLERAEDVANPKGVERGIDKAEKKINTKNNPRNPNTQATEDIDTKSSVTKSSARTGRK